MNLIPFCGPLQTPSEFLAGLGLKGKRCPSCDQPGLEHGEPGSDFRPNIHPGFDCNSARLKTPLSYVQEQHRVMHLGRDEDASGSTSARDAYTAAAKHARIRPNVYSALLSLRFLIPHSCQGPFGLTGFDLLHGGKKGILWVLILVVELFTRLLYTKSTFLKTGEDVRASFDDRFRQCGNNYGHPDFDEGFWGNGDSGSLKGSEVFVLGQLFCLSLAGCSVMISDAGIRQRTLHYFSLTLSLLREFGTPQEYSEEDMSAIEKDIAESVVGMNWFMDTLIKLKGADHGLGHVFDTLKAHLWSGAAKFIRKFGSLTNLDTEHGERSQKELKLHNLRVQLGRAAAALLARLVALRLDKVVSGHLYPARKEVSASRTDPLPIFKNLRSPIGNGPVWARVKRELCDGEHGPKVKASTVDSMLVFLKSCSLLCDFDRKAAVRVDLENASYQEIQPGHTAILDDGTFVQVLLPRLEIPRGPYLDTLAARHGSKDLSLVSFLEQATNADKDTGNHPEVAVPFLKRRSLGVISVHRIQRREHIVPYFGNLYREACAHEHLFLVNVFARPCFRGGSRSTVFWKCPSHSCPGRVRAPNTGFGKFECPVCAYVFPSVS